MSAMSIGHITANIPGLANEIQKSYPGSDLRYALGFGWQLWNFIWQGAMPPGFSHLEAEEEIDEDEDEEDLAGPHLLFCFSASEPDILQELALQSQMHLKNIADVHETVLGTPVESPANPSQEKEKTSREMATGTLIGNQHPEYAQSSFLLALSLTPIDEISKMSPAEMEILNKSLSEDFNTLTENEPGLIHHLYAWKTQKESGHHLLAFCDRTRPFQDILDRISAPSADSLKAPWRTPWKDIKKECLSIFSSLP